MELRENGLLDYFSNQGLYIPGSRESDKCFKKVKNSAKDVPIKLVDLTSAFFILSIGLGLSILCFLLELIMGKYKHGINMRNVRVAHVVCDEDEENAAPSVGITQSDETVIQINTSSVNQLSSGKEFADQNEENAIVVTEIF